MKANILQKSLIVAGMMGGLASMSSQAADADLSFSFETIVDVGITQVTGLDFGTDLSVDIASTCTLLVSDTAAPGSVAARMGLSTTATAATGTYETRTGDCDNSSSGTAGIYAITGGPGVDVDITVNPITATAGEAFSFIPAGVVVDNSDDSATSSTFENFTSGTLISARLPSSADGTFTSGSPIAGQTYLYVGGTLQAEETLDAGFVYNTQEFVVDVVY
jgi:hypothetical protein